MAKDQLMSQAENELNSLEEELNSALRNIDSQERKNPDLLD